MSGKTVTREAWDAAPRQSDMARLLGMPNGKPFRDVSRRVFGIYVSHGDALDARARAFLFAYHVTFAGDAEARIAVVRAWKDGDKEPPTPEGATT